MINDGLFKNVDERKMTMWLKKWNICFMHRRLMQRRLCFHEFFCFHDVQLIPLLSELFFFSCEHFVSICYFPSFLHSLFDLHFLHFLHLLHETFDLSHALFKFCYLLFDFFSLKLLFWFFRELRDWILHFDSV